MPLSQWSGATDRMLVRIDDTAEQVSEGFPHFADPQTGEWTITPAGDWTGGYWPGMLWLALVATGKDRYREWAELWTKRLAPRVASETVFRGFLFYYAASLGHVLAGSDMARELGLEAARELAKSYNPLARVIPLGVEAEESSDVGRAEANVDGLCATPLLLWAAQESGDGDMAGIAVEHALRHIEFCLREDGSVCQSVTFDPDTGDALRRYTHKGYRDESTWTRAQAWAMLWYAVSAIWAPEQGEFLETAMRTADWWVGNVPDDRVAFWDFDAPREADTERDTSGTAIAAAALLKLSELAPDPERRRRYRREGEASVGALVEGYLTPTRDGDHRPVGILTEGCYNHRTGLATSHELIWGDYYLFESLQVLEGDLEAAGI